VLSFLNKRAKLLAEEIHEEGNQIGRRYFKWIRQIESRVSVLDGFPEVDDRPPMTDSQIKTAGRRLVLGISNVGFWVLLSATGIAWLAPSNGRQVQQAELFQWLLAAVAIQSLFDWVGGAVLVPASFDASRGFLSRWGRAILVHSLLLGGAGVLNYWSFHLSGGYGLGVAVSSIALFLLRRQVFCLLSGTHMRLAQIAGSDCWIAQAEDPSFTGGICGAGKNAVALLPEAWTLRLRTEYAPPKTPLGDSKAMACPRFPVRSLLEPCGLRDWFGGARNPRPRP
jgi:hypothetical protein